jgi:hypothetical protein
VPWLVQPVVEGLIRDAFGNLVRDVNAGGDVSVLASLLTPQQRTTLTQPGAPLLSGQARVAATFTAGLAPFSGLRVDAAGANYTLVFTAPGARVRSQPFAVKVGPPVRYRLAVQPGRATGGVPFALQPRVVVEDAGGNVVANATATGAVVFRAELAAAPADVLAVHALSDLLDSTDGFEAAVVDGAASFRGLFVRPAGHGYVLRFRTASPLLAAGDSVLDSEELTVGVGPTARLVLTVQPGGARGGTAFAQQPAVELQDAGGNINEADSYSTVTVALGEDPSAGAARLTPAYLRWPLPPAFITATAVRGSPYLQLSAHPSAALGHGYPRLIHGDAIALGGGQGAAPGAVENAEAVRAARDGACASLMPATIASSTAQAAALPVFPPAGSPGVTILEVRQPPELRLRLVEPWAGPDMTGARLTKVEPALTRPVLRGRAVFEGLTLDRVGVGYRLVFTSSMTNQTADPASDLLQPFGDTAPFGRGYGRVSFGYGYGGDAHSAVPGALAVVSHKFAVVAGDPAALALLRPPGRAWAGGQPFGVQPVAALVDAGGNVLLHRTDDVVVASMASTGAAGNPLGARLRGTRRARSDDGRAEFMDLFVDQPSLNSPALAAGGGALVGASSLGLEYTLMFSVHAGGFGFFRTCVRLQVALSAEYLVTPFSVNTSAAVGAVSNSQSGSGASFTGLTSAEARLGAAPTVPDSEVVDDPASWAAGRFGHALSLSGRMLAVAALYADVPTREVQLVRTLCDASGYTDEVQQVTVTTLWRPAVQRLLLLVPVYEDGSAASAEPASTFVLAMAGVPSQPVRADAHPDFIKAVLEQEVLPWADVATLDGAPPQVGVELLLGTDAGRLPAGLSVGCGANENGTAIACAVARSWQVSFSNVFGPVPLLTASSTGLALSAAGAGVAGGACDVGVIEVRAATIIGGSFTLSAPPPGVAAAEPNDSALSSSNAPAASPPPLHAGSRTTRALAHDVSEAALAAALRADLGLQLGEVRAAEASYDGDLYGTGVRVGVRTWRITFASGATQGDVATLIPDGTALTGDTATVLVATAVQAEAPVGGAFRLRFDGATTVPIAYDATGAALASAVGRLPALLDVTASRTEGATAGTFTWAVSFSRAPRRPGPDGRVPTGTTAPQLEWVSDDVGAGGWPALSGTGAAVAVTSIAAAGGAAPWMTAPMAAASSGSQQGSVSLLTRSGRSWVPFTRLSGAGSAEHDLFGHSVSLSLPVDGSYGLLAVGAPGARNAGAAKVQALVCRATGGTLTVEVGSHATWPLPWDATPAELAAAVLALPPAFRITVEPAGAATDVLCSAQGARTYIRFDYPQEGDLLSLHVHGAALTGGTPSLAVVDDVVNGARVGSGATAGGRSSGAVFIFRVGDRCAQRGSSLGADASTCPARRGRPAGTAVRLGRHRGSGRRRRHSAHRGCGRARRRAGWRCGRGCCVRLQSPAARPRARAVHHGPGIHGLELDPETGGHYNQLCGRRWISLRLGRQPVRGGRLTGHWRPSRRGRRPGPGLRVQEAARRGAAVFHRPGAAARVWWRTTASGHAAPA